jgi:4'-phosphopantetheinyl transferase EntD
MCSDHLQEAAQLFATLLPATVQVAVSCPLAADSTALYPEEWALVKTASVKRQRTFAVGRRLARELLKNSGILDFPLLQNQHRAPI